ncbi:hypothetical protein [Romboutsia sp.]|uniref:hypothetical protein n=1 Tax=Romboutsia sp. TaxID=1965302 RepID=UPI002D7F4AD8|nr:hypothetical protein [Romboutsia sp.]
MEHIYLWQIKEYRIDRMKVYIKEAKVFSLKSYPTIVAFLLATFGILLTVYTDRRFLYIVIPLGFAYYVLSALNSFSALISKKVNFPKKSLRNLLIAISIMVLTIVPIVSAFQYYQTYHISSIQDLELGDFSNIFPTEVGDTGVFTIPLETATVILYFVYLFAFDLTLPFIIALLVFATSFFSIIVRKKK